MRIENNIIYDGEYAMGTRKDLATTLINEFKKVSLDYDSNDINLILADLYQFKEDDLIIVNECPMGGINITPVKSLETMKFLIKEEI